MNTINGVTPKEAQTKNEKLLLGALDDEAKRIGYGTISVEIIVRDSTLDHLIIAQTTKRINIGMRDRST